MVLLVLTTALVMVTVFLLIFPATNSEVVIVCLALVQQVVRLSAPTSAPVMVNVTPKASVCVTPATKDLTAVPNTASRTALHTESACKISVFAKMAGLESGAKLILLVLVMESWSKVDANVTVAGVVLIVLPL